MGLARPVRALDFLCIGPFSSRAPNVIGIDKIGHFFVYGLFGTLLARTSALRRRGTRGAVEALLLVIVYGVGDEFHQSFTPGRTVEWADLVVDTVGAALAITLYRGWAAYHALLERPLGRHLRRVDLPQRAVSQSLS